MLRLAAAVLLIAALPVRANLGDSVADCIKRYGKPDRFSEANAHTPFGTLVFIAGPYDMTIFLFNDVEVGARVLKKDKSAFGVAEIKTIMDADAASPWISTASDDPASQQWTRADKATATYDTSKQMLIFTTPEMVRELHAPPPLVAPAKPIAPPPPPRPPGNFVPAAPTPWAPPQPPSTNAAPATNVP
jgi:hypothetical protein